MSAPPLLWFFLGTALLLAELLTPALVLLFFGLGAWAAALAALAGLDFSGQLVVFMAVALLSLAVLRKRLRRVFGGRAKDGDVPHDDEGPAPHPLTGTRGLVSKALQSGFEGEVSAGGSFWRAVSTTPLEKGAPVVVLGAQPGNGLVLCVAPAPDNRGTGSADAGTRQGPGA